MQINHKVFSLEEFLKEYEFVQNGILGRGHDSNVYLVQHHQSQKYYALKCSSIQDEQHLVNFYNEVQILAQLNHQNIIEFEGYSEDYSCILLEYLPNNLRSIINQGFSLVETKFIFLTLLHAINYLHQLGIAHCDIKPENTLISLQCKIKICDFGLARNAKLCKQLCGGSDGYIAPEFFTKDYQELYQCDIFSLGVTFFVLYFGLMPFTSTCPNKQDPLWNLIAYGHWKKFWTVFDSVKPTSSEFKEIFESMVQPKAINRCTIEQILKNQWINSDVATSQSVEQEISNRILTKIKKVNQKTQE